MKQYRETSRENYQKMKHILRARAWKAYEVVKHNPNQTVAEIRNIYIQLHGPLARNELAKDISSLSTSGHLVEEGKRLCKISGKTCLIYSVCKGEPIAKRKPSNAEIIDFLSERVEYLEATLRTHSIYFNPKENQHENLTLFDI